MFAAVAALGNRDGSIVGGAAHRCCLRDCGESVQPDEAVVTTDGATKLTRKTGSIGIPVGLEAGYRFRISYGVCLTMWLWWQGEHWLTPIGKPEIRRDRSAAYRNSFNFGGSRAAVAQTPAVEKKKKTCDCVARRLYCNGTDTLSIGTATTLGSPGANKREGSVKTDSDTPSVSNRWS